MQTIANFGPVAVAGLVLMLATGCGELNDILEVPQAEGHIDGEVFSFQSGTAEVSGNGYTLTLTDSFAYGCDTTPSGTYLTVVAVDISAEGSVSAAGNVTFNRIDAEFGGLPEGATSGTVTVDRIDEEALLIEGYIDASNSDSEVVGDFSVPICP